MMSMRAKRSFCRYQTRLPNWYSAKTETIQYFFEKVFAEELLDSHVFDVIFDVNDNNTEAMIDVSGPEPYNSNALKRRISLDDYNIKVYRSPFRTAYYLVPIAESMPMPRPVQAQQHASYERNTLSERFFFQFSFCLTSKNTKLSFEFADVSLL
ncbi:hypothetical protein G9C98_008091, partial [Cotesia typhae]